MFPIALFALMLSGAAAPALAAPGLRAFDPDNDGTIDLKEAQTAASAAFAKLEKDSDGTLDVRELKGRVSKKALKAADPDSDGTLDEKEYLALTA